MNRILILFFGTLALVSAAYSAGPLRVLYFTKSSGFEHSVVKWTDGKPGASHSEKVLSGLASKYDLVFTFSKDGSLFAPEYLAQFDVIMFYTSGDLTHAGTDGHPAMTPAGKQALLDAVEKHGRGYVGIHAASDSFHTGESGGGNRRDRSNRYKLHGEASDPFVKFQGGEFINHGPQQVAKAYVIDPHFPGCGHLGDSFECMEEWYSLKDFAPDLHVLLVLETDGMEGTEYQRPDFPIAWARQHGRGRVWFNAMGHREDVWESERFQQMLIGGIEWAGKRVDADVTPKLDKAAPAANTIPPPRPEK
ncbi:MAG: ThuA domain-containing protein [Opitutaceae bacterium]